MSDTTFLRDTSNTNFIPQKWSAKLFKHAFAQNPLAPYMGTGSDSIIQVQKDFLKDKGDKMTVGLRALLTGNGETDNETYEGNEEALTFYDMSYQLHERGHSVRKAGNMTDQSSIFNLRNEAKLALGEWSSMKYASDIITALSGLSNVSFAGHRTGAAETSTTGNSIATVNQTSLSDKTASSLRAFFGGQTAGGTLERVAGDANIDSTTDNLFGTKVISEVKRMAETTFSTAGAFQNPLRPVIVDGEKHYLMFISPYQAKSLKNETAWQQAQRDAGIRGKKNALFTGALGIWDGVVIKETPWCHIRYGENSTTASEYFDSTGDTCASGIYVARGLFCGAQSAVMGYGKMPSWVEEKFDYNTKLGVHTDMIYGVKKTVFNSVEFGCITVDTAVNI